MQRVVRDEAGPHEFPEGVLRLAGKAAAGRLVERV